MEFKDDVGFTGIFKIESIDIDNNIIDVYEDLNLIMDSARSNMAQVIGGVTTGNIGAKIDKFVIGTLGHVGTDILDAKNVDEDGFVSTRTSLFSEEGIVAKNYSIPFDATGGADVTILTTGSMYEGTVLDFTDAADSSSVQRVVGGTNGRTLTYSIDIPINAGNSDDPLEPVIAFTEAALYAGDDIFSMKCFSARVKEDTVKLSVTWSIIF